jgi:hypothetical protein
MGDRDRYSEFHSDLCGEEDETAELQLLVRPCRPLRQRSLKEDEFGEISSGVSLLLFGGEERRGMEIGWV